MIVQLTGNVLLNETIWAQLQPTPIVLDRDLGIR